MEEQEWLTQGLVTNMRGPLSKVVLTDNHNEERSITNCEQLVIVRCPLPIRKGEI